MDCSTPGFPVLHYLLELAQTHVHGINNAIQASHPLSSPSPPAFHLHLQGRQSNQHRRWPARFTNCPQTPKQIRLLPTLLHGNLEFIRNRRKPRKRTPEIQCDLCLPERCSPETYKYFIETTLWIFSANSTPTEPVSQDGRSVAAITKVTRSTVSLVCLIAGKFFISCCSCWQIRLFSWGLYHVTLACSLGRSNYTFPKLSPQSLPSPPLTQATVIISTGF